MTSNTKTTCCSTGTHSNTNKFMALAVVLGICTGLCSYSPLLSFASLVSELFINLLKLVSLPIIFLSIVATASGMKSLDEIKIMGTKVLKYTLLTTVIAASLALVIFLVIDPVSAYTHTTGIVVEAATDQASYGSYLIQMIPSNIVQPFLNNNVVGVLFIAMALSLAILTLPTENRATLHGFFAALYAAIMKITTFVVSLMPVAIWAFITLFFRDLRDGMEFKSLAFYLLCVVLANVIQALVVLPILLRSKGISPVKTFKAVFPALSVAFFAKSSAGALPMAIKCVQERGGVKPKVANFSLPLCTTINMNGCAAFILTTVLFVSMINGVQYTMAEMCVWVLIATVAALGNAGIPMGCYFVSTAFLVAMDVPLNILGVILPFYSFIDMLESAINVWSDCCVTTMVNSEVSETVPEGTEVTALLATGAGK
ncbi:MAG: dicarboxylate/amino acid:cation symporter [Chlamydiales bacterium]|nr:dicarboxylate/amino acid:cation symporter [Chlamydiales bacterium]